MTTDYGTRYYSNELEAQDFLLFCWNGDVLLALSYTETTTMLFLLVRMGSALLSRFDLVFIMLDRPDEVSLLTLLFVLYDVLKYNTVGTWSDEVFVMLDRPDKVSLPILLFVRCDVKSTTQLAHSKHTLCNFPFIILSCRCGLKKKKPWTRLSAFDTIGSICFVVRVVLTLRGTSLQFIPEGGN